MSGKELQKKRATPIRTKRNKETQRIINFVVYKLYKKSSPQAVDSSLSL